jgi:hypothetical protein
MLANAYVQEALCLVDGVIVFLRCMGGLEAHDTWSKERTEFGAWSLEYGWTWSLNMMPVPAVPSDTCRPYLCWQCCSSFSWVLSHATSEDIDMMTDLRVLKVPSL